MYDSTFCFATVKMIYELKTLQICVYIAHQEMLNKQLHSDIYRNEALYTNERLFDFANVAWSGILIEFLLGIRLWLVQGSK